MYKANIYLKYCQRKHAYAAPYPLKGALARFTNFKFSINLCAGSPLGENRG